MSFSVSLKIEGTKNTKIVSGPAKLLDVVGREGEIILRSFKHSAQVPTEKLAPSGQRQHNPIEFTKSLDHASPILMQMLCMGETIKSAEFTFYTIDATGEGTGGEKPHHKIIAEGGQVVSYEVISPDAHSESHIDPYENIKITFKSISSQSIDGPEYKDSWNIRS